MKKKTRADYNHEQNLVKLFRSFGMKYNLMDVFSDFVRISAIAYSNALPGCYSNEREKHYIQTVQKYRKEDVDVFVKILAELTEALYHMTDVLGNLFHALELHNKWTGQFFTPSPICNFMGSIALVNIDEAIKEKGYVSVLEPACGSGALIIGYANAMLSAGYNPQTQMYAECKDIDPRCVHMTYLQLSLLGIPAKVIQGNGLTDEQHNVWYTPFYVINGWPVSNRRKLNLPRAA